MQWIRRAMNRVSALLRRGSAETDLSDELRFHIEQETDAAIARGMSPAAARTEALRLFGGVERFKEECRDVRGVRPLEDMMQDLRHGARALRARPGFTIVAVLTLALGIGATTAIFSAVDGVLLKPLPYADQQRIIAISLHDPGERNPASGIEYGTVADLRERASPLMDIAAGEPYSRTWTRPDGPELLRTWLVTSGFFRILGTQPLLGRTFLEEEYSGSGARVVVIGHSSWVSRFGADSSVIGRVLTLDSEPYTIVGVMPPTFGYPPDRDVWAPKVFGEAELRRRGIGHLEVVARLKPGVTLEAAQSGLTAIVGQLARDFSADEAKAEITAIPIEERIVGQSRAVLLVLLGAVGVVLLIACTNVANLMLARSIERAPELALRTALGAGRGRIVRQLVTESALLAILGAIAGLLFAFWGVEAIRALSPPNLPRVDEMRIDGRALAFALAIALSTPILFGLLPALRAASPNLGREIGEQGRRASPSRRSGRLRGALVVSEVMFAVVLLVGAGLLMRSFVALLHVDRGFDTSGVLAVRAFVWEWYETPESRAAFARAAIERFEAIPGVRVAGVGSALPLAESSGAERATVVIEGQASPREGEMPTIGAASASPGYFGALGIPLREGRMIAASDDSRAAPVVLVNERMARHFWPDESPVGRRITVAFAGRPVSREIVGVVGNVRRESLEQEPPMAIFVPHAQSPTGSITFVLRTDGSPGALAPSVRAALAAMNPQLPIASTMTLDGLLETSLRPRRFSLLILGAFATVALALASIGIHGVMSAFVSERMHEMAVRLALGASRGSVRRLIMSSGARLAAVGVVAGAVLAVGATRLLRGMLYGVAQLDVISFGLTMAVVMLSGLLACSVAAWRAARADPLETLRGG